jgi:CheY-like chemotaxis protein
VPVLTGAVPAAEPGFSKGGGHMVRVLVVDDDADTREILRLVLEDADYEVAETADGQQTIATLETSVSPMVVVLDLDLPRLDGVEVLNAVASDERLAARNAFILLTAVQYTRYQAAAEVCAQLGVPLVLKPFDINALLDAVAACARRLRPER